jgi:hypothetical protein
MTTAFSKVVAAVIASLSTAPAVCDAVNIYRARTREMPEQVDQAVSVQFEGSIPDNGAIAGAPVDWSSKVTVDCFGRSMKDSGDIAVDPLFQAVYERLAQDSTLGGLVGNLSVAGIEAENSAEGKKTGWVRLTYIAEHRTSNLSLE